MGDGGLHHHLQDGQNFSSSHIWSRVRCHSPNQHSLPMNNIRMHFQCKPMVCLLFLLLLIVVVVVLSGWMLSAPHCRHSLLHLHIRPPPFHPQPTNRLGHSCCSLDNCLLNFYFWSAIFHLLDAISFESFALSVLFTPPFPLVHH